MMNGSKELHSQTNGIQDLDPLFGEVKLEQHTTNTYFPPRSYWRAIDENPQEVKVQMICLLPALIPCGISDVISGIGNLKKSH